ncbi:MAG: FkbM family methyltransferase [Flavobacteriales bacterium]
MKNKIRYFFKRVYKRFRAWWNGSDNPFVIIYFRFIFKPKPGSVEQFLDLYSKSTDDFFVVQIGANDGITHDPVHPFIKRDRWSGVLLEPQHYVFEHELKIVYRKHHNLRLVNAALGTVDGITKLYAIGFSNERWATGLARFDRLSLEAMFESGKIAKRAKKAGQSLPEDQTKWIEEHNIRSVTVKTLIKESDVSKIDLLMIDTEGFDAEVVKMFIADDILPNAIVYESFQLSEEDKKECESLLLSKHFLLKDIGPNTVAWQHGLNELVPWQ